MLLFCINCDIENKIFWSHILTCAGAGAAGGVCGGVVTANTTVLQVSTINWQLLAMDWSSLIERVENNLSGKKCVKTIFRNWLYFWFLGRSDLKC